MVAEYEESSLKRPNSAPTNVLGFDQKHSLDVRLPINITLLKFAIDNSSILKRPPQQEKRSL